MLRTILACTFIFTPMVANAQTSAAQTAADGTFLVEVVASGQFTVRADRFRIGVKLEGTGKDADAATKSLEGEKQALVRKMEALGLNVAKPETSSSDGSLMQLFASVAGMAKPTISMDDMNADLGIDPTATATETVQFDAPSRALAEAGLKAASSVKSATPEKEIVALLDDYETASQAAKVDALKKAQQKALAYGKPMGLATAQVVRISEKRDLLEGTAVLFKQVVAMMMPKAGAESDNISVQESLTVEYRLTR